MLSVVICTHNPRRDCLQRCVDALHGQTLPLSEYAAAKGWTVEPDTPHPPIRYEGIVADDLQTVEGHWRAEGCAVRLVGQLAALPFPAFAGTWKAERHQSLIG